MNGGVVTLSRRSTDWIKGSRPSLGSHEGDWVGTTPRTSRRLPLCDLFLSLRPSVILTDVSVCPQDGVYAGGPDDAAPDPRRTRLMVTPDSLTSTTLTITSFSEWLYICGSGPYRAVCLPFYSSYSRATIRRDNRTTTILWNDPKDGSRVGRS